MTIWNFTRDMNRIENGAKLVLGKNADGSEIAVYVGRIHTSNPSFKTAVENARKSRQTEIDALVGAAQREALSELTTDAAANSCIRSWTGFKTKEGAEMACSDDNVALIRKELPELFERIVEFGLDSANYVGQFDEEATLKN